MTISQSIGKNEAQNLEIKRRMLMAYVNLAGIYFKSESFKNAKHACDFALDIDCSSICALQIRALSRIQGANYDLQDMKESLEDLRLALEIDPFNPFSHEKYEQLTKEYKITEFKERVAYGKMFNDQVPYPEKPIKSLQQEGSGNVNGGTGGTGVEGPVVVEEIQEEKKFKVIMDQKLPEIKEGIETNQKLKKKSFKEDIEQIQEDKKPQQTVAKAPKKVSGTTEKKKKKEAFFEKGPSGKYIEMEQFDQLISNANEITEMFEKAGRKEEADEMRDKVKEMTEVKESFEKMFNMDLSLPQNQLLFFAKRRGMDLNKPEIKKEIYHFRVEQLKKLRSFLKKSGPVIRDLKKDSKLAIQSIERSKLKRLQFLRNNQASNSEISKELMFAAFVILFVLVGWTFLNMFLF